MLLPDIDDGLVSLSAVTIIDADEEELNCGECFVVARNDRMCGSSNRSNRIPTTRRGPAMPPIASEGLCGMATGFVVSIANNRRNAST